jgi:serine phosphatase RsbU (regulator of sigma subunit)
MDRFQFPTGRRQMVPGEWLCVVTDGVTEAMNPAREFFGVERLRTSLSWMPEDAAAQVIMKKLREDVSRFAAGAELADDITLVVVKWTPTT